MEKIAAAEETKMQVYGILQSFDVLFDIMDNADRKLLIKELIEKIELYPRQNLSGQWIKTIHFRFPMYYNDNNEASCAVCFDLNGNFLPKKSNDESIVCLRREKVDGYINLTLNVEELGNISHTPVVSKVSETKQKPIIAERKTFGVATYPQIKDYIWEKYGLKVPSAYIAQVKEECGIKERKNYYIGKEGHKVPNCTPEKREAILDAFKHFKMITD